MEPPVKRQCLSPPSEQRQLHESSSSDDDDFYAPAPPIEQRKSAEAPEETDYDDEVEILDEGEEVEEINEADLHIRRAQSLNKIRTKWDKICEKYGREFGNADEIDLNTLEVVVDNGHIAQMQDETDVGNGQPTPRRESRRTENKEGDDGMGQKRRYEDMQRSSARKIHHERRSPRRKSRSPLKSDLRRQSGVGRHTAKEIIYEDDSSDDDFLYEKPAASTAVLAPRQPQAINQIRPRQGSRTVVEKRTVITTKRITTIRDDRSERKGSRDDNHGRHTSHERTSREVQRYTKSSQEKAVETSSDDELVQRESVPPKERVRSPSLDGKDSLWAPKRNVGRPRIHHHSERSERHRPSPRREKREKRVVRYDENGRKIRKPRNDRGKMRVPEHLRKTRFVNKYEGLDLESESCMFEARSLASDPQPEWRSTGSSVPVPVIGPKEALEVTPKPIVFARNAVDKSYDFSDEEDDATPPTRPSLLTTTSTDIFLGQDTSDQPQDIVRATTSQAPLDHFSPKIDETTTFQTPHSPPPAYTEFEYHPNELDQYHMVDTHFAAPIAQMSVMPQMETLHQFLSLEGEPSFMDACLSFSPASPGHSYAQQDHHHSYNDIKSPQADPVVEAAKYESEDDLSIPIDPALLALDAENRAASLERAEAAKDTVDEPGLEGTLVPTLPFEENFMDHVDEDDSDDDLFASEAQPKQQSFFEEAVDKEVSDDGDDLEDYLMPVRQPAAIADATQAAEEKEPKLEDITPSSSTEQTTLPSAETPAAETDALNDITTQDIPMIEQEQVLSNVSEPCAIDIPSSPLSDVPEDFEMEAATNTEDDIASPGQTLFHIADEITSDVNSASEPAALTIVSGSDDVPIVRTSNEAPKVTAEPEQSSDALALSPPIVCITSNVHRPTGAPISALPQLFAESQPHAMDEAKSTSPEKRHKNFVRTEVPDSDADSDDELLTQPSSQPPPRANITSSQHSPAQPTLRTMSAMKRVHFADTVEVKGLTKLRDLPPPRWSPLTDEDQPEPKRSSSPDWQPHALDNDKDVAEEDDEDDIALLPASPVRRSKSASNPTPIAPAPLTKIISPSVSQIHSKPPSRHPTTTTHSNSQYKNEDELSTPKSILKRPARQSTPQAGAKESTSGTAHTSRATLPRLFSLSVSPQSSSEPKQRPKLRVSLLSESASTTPRRIPTPTPLPKTVTTSTRIPSPRLLSASPMPSIGSSGVKRSRSEIQARIRSHVDGTSEEETEVVEPNFRSSTSEESRGRSASAEMLEGDRRCGQTGFRCDRTICFKCRG